MGIDGQVKASSISKFLRLYLGSQNGQRNQRAKCGATCPGTVLEIVPQTCFLKATLKLSLWEHYTWATTISQAEFWRLLLESTAYPPGAGSTTQPPPSGIASAKSLPCIPRSCIQGQPLRLIMTTEKMPCKDTGGNTLVSGEIIR